MKKIIVFISALALSTGVAYAMDEDAMDKDMMMEAPSVSLSGEAELGFRSQDDDNDATEDFSLIRQYKVGFSSTGTTDGGLAFGAGISIEDEEGATGSSTPGVNGANVWVGAGDGTWKLKLGGNDPGIEQAGGIGVADDHFDGGNNAEIGLEGAFGGTSYRLTVADPQAAKNSAADGDWSLGVSHSISDINVGFGIDSEKGLAIGVGTDVSGVGLSFYYSTSEESDASLEATKTTEAARLTVSPADGDLVAPDTAANYNFPVGAELQIDNMGKIENKGLGVSASIAAGEGATLTVGYSKLDSEHATAAVGWYGIPGTTPRPAENAAGYQNINATVEGETKLIDIEFSYDLGGGAKLIAGIEKQDTETTRMLTSIAAAGVLPENGGDSTSNEDSLSSTESTDTTTLTAKLAFTF